MNERMCKLREAINQIPAAENLPEDFAASPFRDYFAQVAEFLELVFAQYDFIESGEIFRAERFVLAEKNRQLYADVLPDLYELSYANPSVAVKKLGQSWGRLFSFLYAELRCLIIYAHEMKDEQMIVRLEVFWAIYERFTALRGLPSYEEIRDVLYNFLADNLEMAALEKIAGQISPHDSFIKKIIMESDLGDLSYLYYFGEYVAESELKSARYLNSLAPEIVDEIAGTFVEGYRRGFEVAGKDMSKKSVVGIFYKLGFEKPIRKAIERFAELGLESTIFRSSRSILEDRSQKRRGLLGAIANRQYDFDHRDDIALFVDERLLERRLEALEAAYQEKRSAAKLYGGPAVFETFGELPPTPATKTDANCLSPRQQQLIVDYTRKASATANRYIPGDETSYTIIAFPTPEIGYDFTRVFNETVALNTLSSEHYRRLQQILIDTLDRGRCVKVLGSGKNKTDLTIMLRPLPDPARQTNFENCTADVNIPVGEVFTTPLLAGTKGVLHASQVFLNGIEYNDFTLEIEDGMITKYYCANYADREENLKLMRDTFLNGHETLPLSEFAIGTNTKAYMMGRKYGIMRRLPILIAEKTGPHFAFGDTCYSHAEDVAVHNPDGKEIVARSNEISDKRNLPGEQAYFDCHTDVTIPYDELGELSVIADDGEKTMILEGGRFALAGLEELNEPFG